MSGIRHNVKKPRLGLVPPFAKRAVAAVLSFGAEKYGRHNWMLGLSFVETYDSMERHMTAWMQGEDIDPESGLPHLAHAACNAMMILELSKIAPAYDDRPCRLTDTELCMTPGELRAHLDVKARGDLHEEQPIFDVIDDGPEPSTEIQPPADTTRPTPPWMVLESDNQCLKCVRCGTQGPRDAEFISKHVGCLSAATWSKSVMGSEGGLSEK